MNQYRNFSLATYFVAKGVIEAQEDKIQGEIAFFKKHLRLDKVYVEPFRTGELADDAQIELVKKAFHENGIATEGGITTTIPDAQGCEKKQRMYNTICYNDEGFLELLHGAVERIAAHFDAFIIDDFFFTNCTCTACRNEKAAFNSRHNISDGSWEAYRLYKMAEVSKGDIIAVAKKVKPGIKITIKFPNWMESFQETGYNPQEQAKLFDAIYTGTETRDQVHHDQHLPRYLSFSLMRYFEDLLPQKNGGGWFDPYNALILEDYLEQAYLTAFSKPKELMMFCFQSLLDTMYVAALGFALDKLDAVLDQVGTPQTVKCYLPHNAQGEDNVHDYLGMVGIPLSPTPVFPMDDETVFLTASSAKDGEVVKKLEAFVAKGGKAIVTSGFLKETMDWGIKNLTSVRLRGRKAAYQNFYTENIHSKRTYAGTLYPFADRPICFPVVEHRNNATWTIVKGIHDEENNGIFMRDTYGKGELYTLAVPESFSDFNRIPKEALSRIRREFAINGVFLEAGSGVGLFQYDNDAIILYGFAKQNAVRQDVQLHVLKGAEALYDPINKKRVTPLYTREGETVFELPVEVGEYRVYQVIRA